MTDDGDGLRGRRTAMNAFHAKFRSLPSSSDKKRAIWWIRFYQLKHWRRLDEEARTWLNRTKEHLKSRL